jgi:hypothetical protein
VIDIVEKLQEVFAALHKIGDFALFSVFLSEDGGEQWDLVVSADWLRNDLRSYDIVRSALKKHLSFNDERQIGRVVILDPTDKAVVQFLSKVPKGASFGRVNFDFGGTRVRRAQIFYAEGTARR